jgi:glycosyltransferase involved in cell wall biosynthesis
LEQKGHKVSFAGWITDKNKLGNTRKIIELPFRKNIYDKNGQRTLLTSLWFSYSTLWLPLKQFDIVETANIPFIHLIPLAIKCRLYKKTLLVSWYEYWGNYWKIYKGKYKGKIFQSFEQLITKIGVLSACSTLTQKRLKIATQRPHIPVIKCGIWFKKLKALQRKNQPSQHTLIYAGRLMKEKRLEILISAIKILVEDLGHDLKVKIIGSGPYADHLKELSIKLRIDDSIQFYGKLENIEDVWKEIAKATLSINPSEREGFGLFGLESMALGTPVIYCESDDNAMMDMIRHRQEGICTEANPTMLAKSIDELLYDRNSRNEIRENGIRRSYEFDWSNIATDFEQLSFRLINSKNQICDAPLETH